MAATTAPLVWDCYRSVSGAEGLGGVVHYYDEVSQSLYLAAGDIATRVAEVPDGHWAAAVPGAQIAVTAESLTVLGLDHPANGTLYGAATDGTNLIFLRYVYAMDLGRIAVSWSWQSQNDNAISQFSASIQNIGRAFFEEDTSLFQPGARISLKIRMGGSEPYPIGVLWLDECEFDVTSETVSLSGRNTIGYYLKDQTFDDNAAFTGASSDIMAAIFAHAGIAKSSIQPGTGTHPFTFSASDALLDGIGIMLAYYTYSDKAWEIRELPDGTVCVGYDYWMAEKQPNGYYTFDAGADVFRRNTRKSADASYTAIRVTGEDSAGAALTPVTVTVTNFPYWALGAHRTKHITAPKGMTQAELQSWADTQAAILRYVGIGEDFTGPFRPQLLVGDVAEVSEGGEGVSLGIITEVRHTFSRSDGYRTEFSVDSGGVVTDGGNYVIYSRAAAVDGYNRRQRVTDLIRLAAGK